MSKQGQGYSGTPLVRKLGLKAGMNIKLVNQPANYDQLVDGGHGQLDLNSDLPYDFIHMFSKSIHELEDKFTKLKTQLDKNGCLWISWPKKSSKMPTDLSGQIVREIGLANGLVDIKVCSVDETWSALKFVYRTKDR